MPPTQYAQFVRIRIRKTNLLFNVKRVRGGFMARVIVSETRTMPNNARPRATAARCADQGICRLHIWLSNRAKATCIYLMKMVSSLVDFLAQQLFLCYLFFEIDGSRSMQSQQFFIDGVCLTEIGMAHIKSMSIEQQGAVRKKRAKRPPIMPPGEKEARMFATIESVVSGALGSQIITLNSIVLFGAGEGDVEVEEAVKEEIYREGMEVPRGEDGKPPEPPEGFTIYTTDSGALILRRKRTRNLQKLGNYLKN